MQESLELPPSDDENNPHFHNMQTTSKQSSNPGSVMGSPTEPASISKFRINRNNESQESLQYSISTCKEDTHRSPKFINLPLLEIDRPKIKVQQERSRIKEIVNIAAQGRGKKLRADSPQTYHPATLAEIDERKTMQTRNNDYMKLVKRNKELEHALQLQTMVSEELRSKLSIMSETLEMNIRQAGIGDFLKLKNSGKSSNIDLFVEFQKLKKEQEALKKETGRESARLKLESEGLAKHLTMRTSEVEKANRTIKSLESQIRVLEDRIALHHKSVQTRESEQRESLISYIEELKQQFSSVSAKYDEGTSKIKLLQKQIDSLKENNMQMTKANSKNVESSHSREQELHQLSQIIEEKNQLIDRLNREASEMREELEEEIIRRDRIIQAMDERILKLEPFEQANLYPDSLDAITKVDIGIGVDRSPLKSSIKKSMITPQKYSPEQVAVMLSSHKKHDTSSKLDKRMMQRLRWQLDSYKQQCEYYHQEYLKKMQESAQLHALKLQYRTDMDYLKDKIRQLLHSGSSGKKHQHQFEKIIAI